MRHNSAIYVISHKPENKKDATETKPADYETAIEATGFGKFNLIYLFFTIPSAWGSHFESTTLSYVVPVAQCDLDLTLQDKGNLNAMCYFGMIVSSLLWGFLSDTLGRKKLLSVTLLLNGFFVIFGGFSQVLPMLLFSKFVSGFIICGPFAIMTTALSEFHCAKHRTIILMIMGIIFGLANILLPSISWAILPLPIKVYLSETFVIHSWNVLIFVTALPSLISGIAHMCFPESPKFLMTVGRNDEALKVFQKIYALNSGKAPETFPIKVLIDEIELHNALNNGYAGVTANRTKLHALKEGFQQIRPLCVPPMLQKVVLICVIQFGIMSGLNTLRLWLPQLFQAINDYQEDYPNMEADLCLMLGKMQPKINATEECTVNFNNDSVYINSMIVGLTTIIGYSLVCLVVNKAGKKRVLLVLGLISGFSGLGLYFAKSTVVVLTLSSVISAFSGICCNAVIAIVVELFPTTSRTTTVAILMMFGRAGALCGNLIFPILLTLGCLPPFLAIGGITILSILLTMALPKTDLKALE